MSAGRMTGAIQRSVNWLREGVRETCAQFLPGYECKIDDQKERRTHPRKAVATMVILTEIREGGSPGMPMDAAVLNVSKKGLCLLVDERINKGSSVMVDLTGRSQKQGKTILAKVTRTQRASGQPGYVLGLRTEAA